MTLFSKKFLTFSALALLLSHNPLYSMNSGNEGGNTPSMEQNLKIDIASPAQLKDVYDYTNKLLESGVNAAGILLVLDVDGTLTNQSQPDPNHEIKPRGNAVNMVKEMIDKGVKVVISSAWKEPSQSSGRSFLAQMSGLDGKAGFKATLSRLDKLGLTEVLGIQTPTNMICGNENNLFSQNPFSRDSLDYCHLGLVASVGKDPNRYFRQKAFSFRYVYPNLNPNEITHVIFADDSSSNIGPFTEDIQKIGLNNNAHVQIFVLSPANGESDLN